MADEFKIAPKDNKNNENRINCLINENDLFARSKPDRKMHNTQCSFEFPVQAWTEDRPGI